MVLIFGIAAAAFAAVRLFNITKAVDPQRADSAVRNIRQSTGVMLALGSAVRGVLDALLLISRPVAAATPQVIPGQATRIGIAAG